MPPRSLLLRPLVGLAALLIVASAIQPLRPDDSLDGPAGAASVAPVASASAPSAAGGSPRSAGRPQVVRDVRHDVSARLASIPAVTTVEEENEESDPDFKERRQIGRRGPSTATPNRTPLASPTPGAALTAAPTPIVSFDGVGNRNSVTPPDTNGDIGPDHYVQWVNLSFAIFDRTGAILYGPANGSTFWKGFGGPCETRNDGDPIVQYDQLADRWMVAQFSLPGGSAGYHECIAVSVTGDPLGAWYRYDFMTSATLMNDYPKFGVWPDGYYMSVNQFSGSTWAGAGAAAFERDAMLAGRPAQMVYFDLGKTFTTELGGMLPSDLDGQTLPPAGAPNVFAQFDDDYWGYSPDRLWLWAFDVDWASTANSTFREIGAPGVNALDSNLCNYSRSCLPQPATSTKLDTLADRLMYRLAYRMVGGKAMMVMNHAVDVSGSDRAGIRWYQLTSTDGTDWRMRQQGDYSPDATNRWIGSIAMNGAGDIGLAYSAASSTVYPSLRFTGRTADATLGTMSYAEGTLVTGSGALTSRSSRFGDYASLSVDPLDDCTFWFTGEYASVTGSVTWKTRIGAFRLAGCTAPTPTTGTVSGTVVDRSTGAALPNVTVRLSGVGPDATTSTNAFGTYGFVRVAPGTYTVTASGAGYVSDSSSGVAVIAGRARTVAFRLQPKPTGSVTASVSSQSPVDTWGDKNGYELDAANVGLTADGAVATDANSGTASSTTCPSTSRDAHDFGRAVTIPAGSLVKGISVRATGSATTKTGTPRFCIQLSPDGGTTWTAGKSTANLSTTSATFSLGGTTDAWGRTWTSSELAGLQVRVVDLGGSTSIGYFLDALSVTVTYQ